MSATQSGQGGIEKHLGGGPEVANPNQVTLTASKPARFLNCSRRSSQIVRSSFGKSLPDNDGHVLAPPFVGIWSLPYYLSAFWRDIDERQLLGREQE